MTLIVAGVIPLLLLLTGAAMLLIGLRGGASTITRSAATAASTSPAGRTQQHVRRVRRRSDPAAARSATVIANVAPPSRRPARCYWHYCARRRVRRLAGVARGGLAGDEADVAARPRDALRRHDERRGGGVVEPDARRHVEPRDNRRDCRSSARHSGRLCRAVGSAARRLRRDRRVRKKQISDARWDATPGRRSRSASRSARRCGSVIRCRIES